MTKEDEKGEVETFSLVFLQLCQAPCILVGEQDIRVAVRDMMCSSEIKQRRHMFDHVI